MSIKSFEEETENELIQRHTIVSNCFTEHRLVDLSSVWCKELAVDSVRLSNESGTVFVSLNLVTNCFDADQVSLFTSTALSHSS